MNTTASDIIKRLEEISDTSYAESTMRFFKVGETGYAKDDIFLGIKVPELRKVARQHKNIPLQELNILISNRYHEVRFTALLILELKTYKASKVQMDEIADFYLQNTSFINNWDLVDVSAYKILGKYLLTEKDRSVLYDLAKSDSLWDRRISIMSCLTFIRQNDFSDTLKLANILLYDREDLIHKAVGWMLREIGNRDFQTEYHFLTDNDRYKKMPRTMLRYAIEKFETDLRSQFLQNRI